MSIRCIAALLFATLLLRAEAPPKLDALQTFAALPVREATVFKDGHALLLHRGAARVDAAGNVVLTELPAPVLGTFFAVSATPAAKLTGTAARHAIVQVPRTALTHAELLRANLGARVLIQDTNGPSFDATILGFPTRSAAEEAATNPPRSEPYLPTVGNLVLLQTDDGVVALPLDRIRLLTFRQAPQMQVTGEELRQLLTLQLDWGAAKPATTAEVALAYVQRGLRWIPNYRITLDGKGQAVVELQATLVNELADLHDVTLNLVVGAPQIAFADLPDPLALQRAVSQVMDYQRDRRMDNGFLINNAIMSQQMAMPMRQQDGGQPTGGLDLGPAVAGAEQREDLHVYTLKGITLRRGERITLPVSTVTLGYTDVYTLQVPLAPPVQSYDRLDSEQQQRLAQLLATSRVKHQIRLQNSGSAPLTTAPALIRRGEQLLAQSLLTYTAVGAKVDLELNPAVNVPVRREESVVKQTPNAIVIDGNHFTRHDLTGTMTLTNYTGAPIQVEVERVIFGLADSADNDGKLRQLNGLENIDRYLDLGDARRGRSFDMSWWWRGTNGLGLFSWDLALPAGESRTLTYTWHYFWR